MLGLVLGVLLSSFFSFFSFFHFFQFRPWLHFSWCRFCFQVKVMTAVPGSLEKKVWVIRADAEDEDGLRMVSDGKDSGFMCSCKGACVDVQEKPLLQIFALRTTGVTNSGDSYL